MWGAHAVQFCEFKEGIKNLVKKLIKKLLDKVKSLFGRRGAQGQTDPEGMAPACPLVTLRNSGTEQRPPDSGTQAQRSSSCGEEPNRESSCFVAGTPVHTPQGCRPIETITIGQRVTALLPQDQTSGRWRTDTVAETFQRQYTGTMVAIQVAGETLRATARHPFWVVRGEELETRPITQELGDDNKACATPGRWVEAQNLREGDRLLTRDRGEVAIEAVSLSEETTTVYNLHVTDCRTYAVSEGGVLVHNTSAPCCRVDDGPGTPGPYASLENTDSPDIPVMPKTHFHPRQRDKILAENEQRNGGQLRSDDATDPAQLLVRPLSVSPTQFPKPPKPRDENNCKNEAQVDHIRPYNSGGSNSYCNARVISQELNERKRHGRRASDPC